MSDNKELESSIAEGNAQETLHADVPFEPIVEPDAKEKFETQQECGATKASAGSKVEFQSDADELGKGILLGEPDSDGTVVMAITELHGKSLRFRQVVTCNLWDLKIVG